jgi:serine/threonine protein kinase
MNKKDSTKKKVGNGQTLYDLINEEIKILKTLNHPNVVWLHEIIDDPSDGNIYIVTEYYTQGSIGDQLKKINQKYEKHNKKCIELGRESK